MVYLIIVEMENRNGKRRRGAVLEEAILDAAWRELTENGYEHFTIEAVAARAQTSRPVLYRRWPQRAELALAAMQNYWRQHPIAVPDTHSLRGDLVKFLRQFAKERAGIMEMFLLRMNQYFAETRSTPEKLREGLVFQYQHRAMDTLLDRAVARKEIDPKKLTPLIRALPASWIGHEIMMTFKPPSDAIIAEFVDQIFLPLVGVSTRAADSESSRCHLR